MISLSIILLISIYTDITLSAECSHDACVYVKNECSFNLYLQRDRIDDIEDVTELGAGNDIVLDITGWKDTTGGDRLYGWWQDPRIENLDPMLYREKVEINWYCGGQIKMCYNPTSVDYFGLPVQMGPYNSNDCPGVGLTPENAISLTDIKLNCPTTYVPTGAAGVCKSPLHRCILEPSHEICDDLDDGLNKCKSDGVCPSSVTSTELWGCSGSFMSTDAGRDICAALHRGVYGQSNQYDPNTFYVNEPYNKYSKLIHSNGIKQYAFPYDDVAQQGGYKECETNFLSVIFCA